MAVVPQIRYNSGSVRGLAKHDVGGPGRVARAEARAAQQIGQAAIGVANANARAAEAEFGIKSIHALQPFKLEYSAILDEQQQIEDMDQLAGQLFKAAVIVDDHFKDNQVKEAELIYEDQLGQLLPQVASSTHRVEPVDPDNPALGTRQVSNADQLVDNTAEAMRMAETAALTGVSNGRARAALEDAFARNRVAKINEARVTAVEWQRKDNEATSLLRIQQALDRNDVPKAERFLDDAVNAGHVDPTQAYKVGQNIMGRKIRNGYIDEEDKVYNVYDAMSSHAAAEQIHKEISHPDSKLTAEDRAYIKAATNEKVGNHWLGQVDTILAMPEQKMGFEQKMESLEQIATRMSGLDVGKDGFATSQQKQTMINSVLSARTKMKTYRNEHLKEVRAAEKYAKDSMADAHKQIISNKMGIMANVLKDPSDLALRGADSMVNQLSKMKPEELLGEGALWQDHKKLITALEGQVADERAYREREDAIMTEAVEDQDDKIHNDFKGLVNSARIYSASEISYLGQLEDIQSFVLNNTYEAMGLSDETEYDKLVGELDGKIRSARTAAADALEAQQLIKKRQGYQSGAEDFRKLGASTLEKQAYEDGYNDIGMKVLEATEDPAQAKFAQLTYMVQNQELAEQFKGDIRDGLISDNPQEFLDAAGQMMTLKASGHTGAALYNEAMAGLQEDDRALIKYGVTRRESGLSLTPKQLADYRKAVFETNPTTELAREKAFKANKLKMDEGVPAGYKELETLVGNEGYEFEALPPQAREMFMIQYQQYAKQYPAGEGSEMPVAAKMAYHDMRQHWAPSTLGADTWVNGSVESAVAGGQITPPWLKQEFTMAADDARVPRNTLKEAFPVRSEVQDIDAEGNLVRIPVTLFMDRYTGKYATHGKGSTSGKKGDVFMVPDVEHKDSRAYAAYREQIRLDTARTRIAQGQGELFQLLRMTPNYNSKAEAVNFLQDMEASYYAPEGVPSYAKAVMANYTEAASLAYPDPSARTKPSASEMFWVEKEIEGRLAMLVEQEIITERQASEKEIIILQMLHENAKSQVTTMERHEKRVKDNQLGFEGWIGG
jgi:methionine aminopeptidase